MDCSFFFHYQERTYAATAYFSFESEPGYVFVLLRDKDLARHFGEDITLKTDGERLLSKADDHYPDLLALRQAMFDAVKQTPAFQAAATEARKQNHR